MKQSQIQLLQSLGSGVRPVDLGEQTPGTGDRFGEMLKSAMHGRARSEVGVTMAPSVSGMFDLQQRESIARAVDIAAAAGSERALILHDTHAVRVDVRNRVVSDAPELHTDQIVTGIDSVVRAQGGENDEEHDENDDRPRLQQEPLLPARVVRNASLVRSLAQAGGMHKS